MFSDPILPLMVAESTRRALTEPERVGRRRSRRTAARVLQRAAHRLDPYLGASPRMTLGR
jgi:hypothetical protein